LRNFTIAFHFNIFNIVDVLSDDGLDEEDLVTADGLLKAGVDLAVGELLEFETLELESEDVSYPRGEGGVAGSAIELDRNLREVLVGPVDKLTSFILV